MLEPEKKTVSNVSLNEDSLRAPTAGVSFSRSYVCNVLQGEEQQGFIYLAKALRILPSNTGEADECHKYSRPVP